MSYTAPKTNYNSTSVIGPDDFNNLNKNILFIKQLVDVLNTSTHIENRTSDKVDAAIGDMWIRTDLLT